MKTRTWALLLLLALVVSVLISAALFFPRAGAAQAKIYSNGVLVKTVSLTQDQQFTVTTGDGGSNTVTVRDGKIAVTDANCPDGYCIHRGFCSGGGDIICLPNRLVIVFVASEGIDALAG